jgi:hypothetical protein
MIGTPSPLASLDDAARLRANSAASWGAILAGAVVAVSLSLVLLTLGAGLGFASISPWKERGVSAGAFTVASTIWLIVTQWLSAAAGGYIAGRLRQRWLATHTHEVFFRDTAHGLVTWAVATLIVAAVLAGSATSLFGGAARAAAGLAAAGGPEIAAMGHPEMPGTRGSVSPGPDPASGPMDAYNLDKLLRSNSSGPSPDRGGSGRRAPDARAEVMHIAATAASTGEISDEDRAYLANLVAAETGVSSDESQKRVDTFVQTVKDAGVQAKSALDEARKSAATAALYTALALLIGAFISSVSAAIGGRLRDEHL